MTSRIEQRTSALRRANEIRTARAQLKRDIYSRPAHASLTTAADIVRNPPEWAHSMDITSLLRACRGLGRVKASGVVKHAQITWPRQRLARLTPKQREAVAAQLQAQAEAARRRRAS